MNEEYNQPPQRQLTEEEKFNLQQKKLQNLQKAGMTHIPQAPINPGFVSKTGSPTAMSKLDEIKRGMKKGEFSKIIYQGDKIPMDKSQQQQMQQRAAQQRRGGNPAQQQQVSSSTAPTAPPSQLFEKIAPVYSNELAEAERILNGDLGMSVSRPGQSFNRADLANQPQGPDDGGADFVRNFAPKFYSSLQEKQRQQAQVPVQENQYYQQQDSYQPQPGFQPPIAAPAQIKSGMIIIDEEDLKKKIISISTQVSKKVAEQMIKSVLSEYLKISKNTIVESEKVKKAEIVGENVVKIDGKLFKLVPATVKKVSE